MVDVGANIGALTFGVAAFNYSVLAFEPMLVNVAGAASGHGHVVGWQSGVGRLGTSWARAVCFQGRAQRGRRLLHTPYLLKRLVLYCRIIFSKHFCQALLLLCV